VDTTQLEQSFASAEPDQKSSADNAVAAIKQANFPVAATELQRLASDLKLTPEQQQAVKDVLAQVQKAMTDTVENVATEGSKAVGDLQQSLPK
jgi:hypothetical protein